MKLTAFLRDKSSFNPFVTSITLFIVILLVAFTLLLPGPNPNGIGLVKSDNFPTFQLVLYFSRIVIFIFLDFCVVEQFRQYQVRYE